MRRVWQARHPVCFRRGMTPTDNQTTLLLPAPAADAPIAPARWPAVAFVCGRCEDRKGAPKSLDGKKLGQRLREAFRDAKLRSRIVHTGCMGLCPRGAMVAAISLGGGPLHIAEPRRKREVAGIVQRLTSTEAAQSPPTPESTA